MRSTSIIRTTRSKLLYQTMAIVVRTLKTIKGHNKKAPPGFIYKGINMPRCKKHHSSTKLNIFALFFKLKFTWYGILRLFSFRHILLFALFLEEYFQYDEYYSIKYFKNGAEDNNI